MRRLVVFNNVTLDGYFTDKKGDMSWAHGGQEDAEWNAFVSGNARGGGELVFGRVTYELMAGFWTTPLAAQAEPVVAQRMNEMTKVVFSRTLDKTSWSNTKLVKGDLEAEVRKLKQAPGEDMTILGSGSIVAQLARAGLVDEYQLVVNPIALGQGRTLFEGLEEKLTFKPTQTRTFGNGKILLCYVPAP